MIINDSDRSKRSHRGRYLSPSFKKGVVTEKLEEDEFKLNLVSTGEDADRSSSPSPKKTSHKNSEDLKINLMKSDEFEFNSSSQKKIPDIKSNASSDGHTKSIASHSQAGKGEDGFNKVNQDSFFVIQNEYKLPDFNIFAVLDGHGEFGHLVSRFVTKYFVTFFKKNKKMKILKSEDEVYSRLKKNDYDILKRVFKHAEKDITKSQIDAKFSGTTCVMVFQIGEKIICANVGDSRAIMVKGEKADIIIPLSIDQKPNDPEEKKRIESQNGEVDQLEEDGEKTGPFRVWAKGQVYPGIAMSRSIGDFVASTLGVIPEPICFEQTIDKDTKFIILGSDGIWEFLENKKVAEIVLPFYEKNNPEGACKELKKKATELWNKEDIVVDDITCIVVFF
jgi:serine/threonine protein phosphatase PrpC